MRSCNKLMHSIIIFAFDYKPQLGGIAEWSYQVALELHRVGWNVLLFAPETFDEIESEDFDLNQPFETFRKIPVFSGGPFAYMRFSFKLFKFLRLTWNVIKSNRVKYIIATEVGIYAGYKGFFRYIFTYFSSAQKAIVFHGLDIDTFPKMSYLRQSLLKYIIAKMDQVFCNSNYTGQLVKSVLSLDSNPTVVGCGINPNTLPTIIDRKVAREILNISSHHVILTVGRLTPRKGIDMVIKSLPDVLSRYPDLLYVVAGEGDDIQRLNSLVREYGFSKFVRFDGKFDHKLIAHYYSSANIFIMPSRHIPDEGFEGFGIVYIEAGFYGLPVIGGNAGGARDAIVDGETGLLVNPEDKNEISKTIIKLLENQKFSQQLGLAGQKRVLETLTWKTVTERIINSLEKNKAL